MRWRVYEHNVRRICAILRSDMRAGTIVLRIGGVALDGAAGLISEIDETFTAADGSGADGWQLRGN